NYYREVMERIRATPGVAAVSAINHAPLTGDVWGTRFRVVGRPEPRPGEWPGAVYRVAWPGYFQVMRTAVVRGREFTERDTMEAPRAVVINEAAARRYWPAEDAVGQRVWASGETWTVVGVVRNLKQGNWLDAPQAEMYFPVLQSAEYLTREAGHYEALSFVVRVAGDAGALAGGDAGALAGAVRQAIESVDANVLVSGVTTMEDAVDRQLWRQRLSLLLLGAFGMVALALAVTGIYGVISQAVSQRTQEIGIRMALGAARGDVMWLAVRQGLAPVVVGIVVGVGLALAFTRWMSTMLYVVEATDAATFAGVAAVMSVAAIFAAFWPARRAARVDPMVALRR
ncbi:MAG: FtsX-like permease family protein, partial [Acidobacteriota bacterium]